MLDQLRRNSPQHPTKSGRFPIRRQLSRNCSTLQPPQCSPRQSRRPLRCPVTLPHRHPHATFVIDCRQRLGIRVGLSSKSVHRIIVKKMLFPLTPSWRSYTSSDRAQFHATDRQLTIFRLAPSDHIIMRFHASQSLHNEDLYDSRLVFKPYGLEPEVAVEGARWQQTQNARTTARHRSRNHMQIMHLDTFHWVSPSP